MASYIVYYLDHGLLLYIIMCSTSTRRTADTMCTEDERVNSLHRWDVAITPSGSLFRVELIVASTASRLATGLDADVQQKTGPMNGTCRPRL